VATKTRTAPPASLRSTAEIPLRPAPGADRPGADGPGVDTPGAERLSDTRTGRIPLAHVRPSVAGGLFRPSAVVGEAVPFRVTAFREGHDLIGVHVRLTAPSGTESLHRLTALQDGFDRWAVLVAPLEQGV